MITNEIETFNLACNVAIRLVYDKPFCADNLVAAISLGHGYKIIMILEMKTLLPSKKHVSVAVL